MSFNRSNILTRDLSRNLSNANTVETRPIGSTLNDVFREDMDVDDEDVSLLSSSHFPMDFTKVSEYLSSNIYTYTTKDRGLMMKQLKSETNSKGYRVIWVENPVTREYVRVDLTGSNIDQKLIDEGYSENISGAINSTPDQNRSGDHTEYIIPPPHSLRSKHEAVGLKDSSNPLQMPTPFDGDTKMIDNMKIVYGFIQGILAGFCFVSVFIESGRGASDEALLDLYQPLAQSTRRFFFLLSSISCVGTWDIFLTIYRNKSGITSDLRLQKLVISFFVTTLQSVVFILTVTISAYDTLIANKFGHVYSATYPDWISDTLASSKYKTDISSWRSLSSVRVGVCFIAWLGFCFLLHKDFVQSRQKSAQLSQLYRVGHAWKERVSIMEGRDVESLSESELQRLNQIQKLGYDRVFNLLVLSSSNKGDTPLPSPIPAA